MRRSALAAVSLALTVALSGCSNGDNSEGASTPTTGGRAGRASTGDPFCDFYRDYSQRFGRIDPRGAAEPNALRALFQEAATALGEAHATAPEAVKADVKVLNDAFAQFTAVFEQAGFDITKVQLPAIERINTPQFTDANRRIDTYMRQHCPP